MTFGSEIIWLSIEIGEKRPRKLCLFMNTSVTSRTKNEGIEVQVGVEFSKQSIGLIDLFNMELLLSDSSVSISM
jgi:hypothetical protein